MTVSRQPGGTVTSSDGQINCGTAPAATSCGPATYAWDAQAILVATPDAGFMFGTWAGDCIGRTKTDAGYVCVLDTTRYGADKYVVPVFDVAGRAQHTNFDPSILLNPADPDSKTLHGSEFLDWVAGKLAERTDTFDCAYCHGSTYAGIGIAPSCNACHERAGYPGWQTNCQFCHYSPPPPDSHPASAIVATDGPPALPGCASCHADTVDAEGNIIPDGPHMDGKLDGGGHEDGYAAPAVHGRDFFATAAVTPTNRCQKCHGAEYASPIVSPELAGGDQGSCNSCHLAAGWTGGATAGTGWQTNCSFCHGERSSATQAAPYDVNAYPTRSSPPDAIQERLDGISVPERTGAHTRHLASTTYTESVWCGSCHEVPTDLTHISGANERAAMLPALGYDADGALGRSLTCATACHGANPSPAWTSVGPLACNGCHAVPPMTSAHAGLTGTDLGGECSGCHPNTITAAGTINLAGGGHINGALEAPPPHDSVDGKAYSTVSVHGARYLGELAGILDPQMGQSCNTCHTNYKSCDACHASTINPAPAISWNGTNWRSNCTFCHGTREATYTVADLPLASPGGAGDTVRMRLESTTTVTVGDQYRIGKHRSHVQQENATSDAYPAVPCGGCHVVPTTLAEHAIGAGPDRNATVTFDARKAFPGLTEAQYSALPNPIATILPFATNSNGTIYQCFTYCHGSAPQSGATLWGGRETATLSLAAVRPQWRSTYGNVDCDSCHANPPPTGKQVLRCDGDGDGTLELCSNHQWHDLAANGAGCGACHTPAQFPTHVSGVKDITLGGWDAAAKTCTSVACHSSPGTARSWY